MFVVGILGEGAVSNRDASGDKWVTGDAYEAYMGRWSRPLARVFAEWLHAKPSGHWLEVGCGTAALTSAICNLCQPASVVACDPAPAREVS
jgi:hypothetical protein